MKKSFRVVHSDHGHNCHNPERNLEIDVTLAMLCRVRRPGVEIPGRIIGEICGMSHAGVHAIEQRALRKLRLNPRFHLMTDRFGRKDFAA